MPTRRITQAQREEMSAAFLKSMMVEDYRREKKKKKGKKEFLDKDVHYAERNSGPSGGTFTDYRGLLPSGILMPGARRGR